jgi:hypothetical protein
MVRVVLPFPVAPGKTAADVRSIAQEFQRRPKEFAESRRRLGVTLERAYLQTTPMGMFLVAYSEGDVDFAETTARLVQSDLDIDKYFVRAVKEVHGVDLTQPPQGPPPETVGEWVDPEVTELRKGMAFCAPVIPGTEEYGRAFAHDAFSRPAMTESRRALQESKEIVTIMQTPGGPVAGVYLEGVDPAEANRRFAASTSEFDTWFKGELTKIFPPVVDFSQPVPGVEEIFDSAALLAHV